MASKIPDENKYPEESSEDFTRAVRAALDPDEGDKWTHHRKGRYTAHQTYMEDHQASLNDIKERCVVVTECERETIAILPSEYAESVLALLEPFESDVKEAMEEMKMLKDSNRDAGNEHATASFKSALDITEKHLTDWDEDDVRLADED